MGEVSRTNSLRLEQGLDTAVVSAPAARHRLNGFRDDFGLFDREVTTDRVVMKGSNRRGLHHVKTGQITAGGTSIAGGHALNGTGLANHLNHASRVLGGAVD